jgi:hypothetical protein
MKRNITILLLGLSVFLTGCISSQTGNTGNPPTQETVTQESQATQITESPASQEQIFVQKDDVDFTGLKPVARPKFITPDVEASIIANYNQYFYPESPDEKTTWDDVAKHLNFFEFGIVTEGQYKNSRLYLLRPTSEEMGMDQLIYRFAHNETTGKFVMLEKYSSPKEDAYEYISPLFENIDNKPSIQALDLPETIRVPGSVKTIKLNSADDKLFTDSEQEDNFKLTKVAFKDSVAGNVYFAPEGYGNGCLYVKKYDGSIASYVYAPGIFDTNMPVTVTWKNDGEKEAITDAYNFAYGSCGITSNCYIIADVNKDDLALQGITSNGVDLFAVSKPLSKEQQKRAVAVSKAQTALSDMYDQYVGLHNYDMVEAVSFNTFVKSHPLLYFRDPMGRWVAFIRSEYQPAAECGKPVIYLYPQEDTDVRVQVGIDRLTATIPDYGTNGWFVRATPESKIYNYADGKTYPYLFWEGQSDTSVAIDKGFVVPRGEVSSFLDNSLTELGLTTQERADFKDFWLSRMLDNKDPYFYVSFLGTSDFNKVAPLAINPKPDTLIRVFMYYAPMREKINVMPETLSAIPRKGFTVVEWGGTASVHWKK